MQLFFVLRYVTFAYIFYEYQNKKSTMKHALVLLRLNGKKSEKYPSNNNEKIVKVCLRLIEDLQYIYFRSVLVNDMQPGLPLKTFFENV